MHDTLINRDTNRLWEVHKTNGCGIGSLLDSHIKYKSINLFFCQRLSFVVFLQNKFLSLSKHMTSNFCRFSHLLKFILKLLSITAGECIYGFPSYFPNSGLGLLMYGGRIIWSGTCGGGTIWYFPWTNGFVKYFKALFAVFIIRPDILETSCEFAKFDKLNYKFLHPKL